MLSINPNQLLVEVYHCPSLLRHSKDTSHPSPTDKAQKLTLPVSILHEEKKLTYFHTSLQCLKRFYEGPKGLHKTF